MSELPNDQPQARPGKEGELRRGLVEMYRRGLRLPKLSSIDASVTPLWFHAGQLRAWESGAQDVVVVAGTQGGKTSMQPHWLLREIQRCAPLIKKLGRGSFVYAGPTLTLLEQQAIPAFRELFEEELQLGRFIQGRKPRFLFSKSGLRRLLGFADCSVSVQFAYTNDSSNLESITALAGVWDEAGQKENRLSSFRAFNRRLKLARTQGFGRRLWGTTPYEWGWFKQHVVDVASRREQGYELYSFPSWLNPLVSREECDRELANGMPLWEWQMMYEGSFTRPRGIIYDCFSASNVVPRFEIPKAWKRFPGVDFGNVNTAAVLVAAERERLGEDKWGDPTGRLFVYRTYKKAGDSASVHARALQEGEPRTLIGAGGSHQEAGWRQAFRAHGVVLLDPPPSIRDVEVQIQCVYSALASGDLLVFEDLSSLLDEIYSFSRELDDSGEPMRMIKDESKYHLLAALRYVVSQLRPPRGAVNAKVVSRFGGSER